MTRPAPRARFRLYTRLQDYLRFGRDVAIGSTAAGDSVTELERALEAHVGTPHAICLPQARVGIYLGIKHLIKPGQKVVLSPYTIADVINMVICAGGVPVFADIDRPSTNVRPDTIEALVDGETGAVMVTHLHGIACDVQAIAALCRARNIPLIEDASQSFGAIVDGKQVGTIGDVGIFSFGMYKSVTAFYGGALVTRRRDVADAVRADLARAPYMSLQMLGAKAAKAFITDLVTSPPLFRALVYWMFRFGYLHDVRAINRFVTIELDTSRKTTLPPSYLRRMRPVQARMVRQQLPNVESDARTRLTYSRIYHEGLRDLADITLPPFRDDGSCVYNYFPIQYRDRVALVKWMMRHGRDLAVQHLKNCAGLESFAPEFRPCPNADRTANEVILLPNYPEYGEASVRANIAAIRSFFAAGAGRDGRR
jgi:perosamine synthetase